MNDNEFHELLFDLYQRDQMYAPVNFSVDLRFDFIGVKLNLEGLSVIARKTNETSDKIEWDIKVFKTKEENASLITDHDGNVLYIDLIDLSDDQRAYKKILSLLNPLVISKPQELNEKSAKKTCIYIIENVQSDSKGGAHNFIPLFALLRIIDKINDEDVVTDLPYLFGGFGLKDEFYYTLITLYNRKISPSAESLTNIGAVLFNVFNNPVSAMMCFEGALHNEPFLKQARSNIWIVSKKVMIENINNGYFQWAVDAGERARNVLGNIDDANFYIILGFAHEKTNNLEKANNYYQIADKIDVKNQWTNTIINQLLDTELISAERMTAFQEFINNIV